MRFTISPTFVAAIASKSGANTKRELATHVGIAPLEFRRFLHGCCSAVSQRGDIIEFEGSRKRYFALRRSRWMSILKR